MNSLTKDCNFDLYHRVQAVCTSPPGYQYADRLLPSGTAKSRRLIEGEKGKKKRKRRKKERGRRKKYLVLSSPVRHRRPCPRVIFLLHKETDVSPSREKD
ncbi:hypothetical protein B296_00049053 [Ensete ventricosum]|uniref:Uncharacterized protein n=1 Tax=Ensete ventricosum TaxID=4639 RepID=A0A426YSG8_ENSVE|nr:hypothetical protein B296_00049053 [Ensete ventricosum]